MTQKTIKKRLSLKAEEILSKHIVASFKKRRLLKGVSQVISAIISHRKMKMLFIVGTLDPFYARALDSALKQTKTHPKIFHLHKKYQNFVYKYLKDVSLNDQARTSSRRFFKCRAFAL